MASSEDAELRDGVLAGTKFSKMQNPAAAGAVEIGHVDGERVDALGGKYLLGLGAGRKSREIGRAASFGGVGGFGARAARA